MGVQRRQEPSECMGGPFPQNTPSSAIHSPFFSARVSLTPYSAQSVSDVVIKDLFVSKNCCWGKQSIAMVKGVRSVDPVPSFWLPDSPEPADSWTTFVVVVEWDSGVQYTIRHDLTVVRILLQFWQEYNRAAVTVPARAVTRYSGACVNCVHMQSLTESPSMVHRR